MSVLRPNWQKNSLATRFKTVQQEGWSSVENGALLSLASGQFSVFVTVDKQIEHTQKLPADLAVVKLRARTNRIESLRPLVRLLEERKRRATRRTAEPGRYAEH